MATMLAVLTTDAAVDPTTLRADLQYAAGASFNRVVVDGCTSTNDTVLVLANGRAGAPDPVQFSEALAVACLSLARQMAGDAEGHTKVVTVEVVGAADDGEAERAARKLATSLLVKCSFYGEDPYWGRVLSDLGTADVALDTDAVTIAYDDVVASKGLAPTGADASYVLARPTFTLRCDLGVGTGSWFLLTNDLSHAYIDENMGTS
jgi:glutamate N-acetyltransferase/amino-acid N-acetyltransferase